MAVRQVQLKLPRGVQVSPGSYRLSAEHLRALMQNLQQVPKTLRVEMRKDAGNTLAASVAQDSQGNTALPATLLAQKSAPSAGTPEAQSEVGGTTAGLEGATGGTESDVAPSGKQAVQDAATGQRPANPPMDDDMELQRTANPGHGDDSELQRAANPVHHCNDSEPKQTANSGQDDDSEQQRAANTGHGDDSEPQRAAKTGHDDDSETQRAANTGHGDDSEPQRAANTGHGDDMEPQRAAKDAQSTILPEGCSDVLVLQGTKRKSTTPTPSLPKRTQLFSLNPMCIPVRYLRPVKKETSPK